MLKWDESRLKSIRDDDYRLSRNNTSIENSSTHNTLIKMSGMYLYLNTHKLPLELINWLFLPFAKPDHSLIGLTCRMLKKKRLLF